MNTFMNLVKNSLIKGGIRGRIRVFKEVGALVGASLLLTLNLLTKPWPISLSYSLVKSAKGLIQGLHQV